jgi:hypothetical protein
MDPEQLLSMQEQAAIGIAALTGIKKQLVDAGWSEHSAELVVIEMLRSAPKN